MIHLWIILGTLVPFFIIFATLPRISDSVTSPYSYDSTTSGLSATTVQEAFEAIAERM